MHLFRLLSHKKTKENHLFLNFLFHYTNIYFVFLCRQQYYQRYPFCQSIKISLASPLQSFFGTFERFLQLNWNFLFNKSFSNSASKIQTEIYIIKISLKLIRSVLVQWLAFQSAMQKVLGSNPRRSKFLFPKK